MAGEANSFSRGCIDKWGNVFGVPLSRREKYLMRRAAETAGRIDRRWSSSARMRAKSRKPTKVSFSFLENE